MWIRGGRCDVQWWPRGLIRRRGELRNASLLSLNYTNKEYPRERCKFVKAVVKLELSWMNEEFKVGGLWV